MAYIGARLRQARKMRGLSQERLAALVPGMTREDISNAEHDKIVIGDARLARLAAALEISVLELQPEAEPDERGWDLLDHLAKLGAAVDALIVGQQDGIDRLDALREMLDERLPARPVRRKRRPS